MQSALSAGLALALVMPVSRLHAEPLSGDADGGPRVASAQEREADRARENAVYRPLVPADYGIVGFLGALRFYFAFAEDPPSDPTWVGPILFDQALRDDLRATTYDGRANAKLASDLLVVGSYVWVASDALIAGGFGEHPDWALKWNVTVIDLQALALSATVTEVMKAIALRERPDAEPCAVDPGYSKSCGVEMTESFPSGHSSAAAVAAGLVCTHHLKLGLYGSLPADVGACVASSAMAVSTGALRVVADRHYATDVVAGLLIGGSIGVAWPLWFHAPRRTESGAASDTLRFTVLPIASPTAPSLQVLGEF